MKGSKGFIIIPANIPLSVKVLIVSNLLDETHTLGSIIFDISSFGVVIVILIITLFFSFISFNKSKSLNIKLLLVSIETPKLYLDNIFNAPLVCSYFNSCGLYVSDIEPIPTTP